MLNAIVSLKCPKKCQHKGPGKRGHIVADTLLRTHCCRHKCFPVCPRADTNLMFLILFRNILCPQQMFPSLRSPRNTMGNKCSQQCVLVYKSLPRGWFGTLNKAAVMLCKLFVLRTSCTCHVATS